MLEANQIELKIREYLLAEIPSKECAAKLIEDWSENASSSKTSKDNLRALEVLCYFCIQVGAFDDLFPLLAKELKDDVDFPWGHFSEALFLFNPVAAKKLRSFILEGATEQGMMDHLGKSEKVDNWEDFSSRRAARLAGFQYQWDQKISELKSQIELCASQNLDDEEERLILKLGLLAPNEPMLINRSKQISKRKIQSAIQNDRPKSQKKSVFVPPRKETMTPEVQVVFDQLVESMKDAAKSNPNLLPDFSIAMLMMNEPERSLDFIPDNIVNFLKIEILLKAHKNVSVLELLDQYELEHPDLDPFDIAYYKAQAYWGLNRKKEAIEMMSSICKVKPDFRLADSILEDWRAQISQDWS